MRAISLKGLPPPPAFDGPEELRVATDRTEWSEPGPRRVIGSGQESVHWVLFCLPSGTNLLRKMGLLPVEMQVVMPSSGTAFATYSLMTFRYIETVHEPTIGKKVAIYRVVSK